LVYLAVMAVMAGAAVQQRLVARPVAGFAAASPAEHVAAISSLEGRRDGAESAGGTPAFPAVDLLIPVAGVSRGDLRDDWGDVRGGGTRNHTAIDILAPRGTPAIAAVKGTVIKLHSSRAGGLTLYLADESRSLIYYYAHLDSYSAAAREGNAVEQGEVLGHVGTSGNAPPGTPHLHFGIERLPASGEWWKGEPMNPYPILVRRGITRLEPLR
jgi:murein DD-endopeptidase MepM/ murein hydrolase activator NlpD